MWRLRGCIIVHRHKDHRLDITQNHRFRIVRLKPTAFPEVVGDKRSPDGCAALIVISI